MSNRGNYTTGIRRAFSAWIDLETWRSLGFLLAMIPIVAITGAYVAIAAIPILFSLFAMFLDPHSLYIPTFALGALLLIPIVAGASRLADLDRRLIERFMRTTIPNPPPFTRPKMKLAEVSKDGNFTFRTAGLSRTMQAAYSYVPGWRALAFMGLSVLLTVAGLFLAGFTLFNGLRMLFYPLYWRTIQTTPGFFPQGLVMPEGFISFPSFSGPPAIVNETGDIVARINIPIQNGAVFHFGSATGFLPRLATRPYDFALWQSRFQIQLNTPAAITGIAILGLVLVLLFPLIIRGIARLITVLGTKLLGPTGSEVKVSDLRAQRAAVVQDSDLRLRQIERDLHDGTQAQLVVVAMQLGEVQELLAEGDIEPAIELVNSAQAQVKETLNGLTDIASGIHPPALDAGLSVALQTLTARSPVPITLLVGADVDVDLDPTVRAIAYYSISELLQNITKHAQASSGSVEVFKIGTMLHVRVRDNGVGGAAIGDGGIDGEIVAEDHKSGLGHGTGLAGIADRLASIDGTFACSSPAGGPTVIDMMIPLDVNA